MDYEEQKRWAHNSWLPFLNAEWGVQPDCQDDAKLKFKNASSLSGAAENETVEVVGGGGMVINSFGVASPVSCCCCGLGDDEFACLTMMPSSVQ